MKKVKFVLLIILCIELKSIDVFAQSIQHDTLGLDQIIKESIKIPIQPKHRDDAYSPIESETGSEERLRGPMMPLASPPPEVFNPCSLMLTQTFPGITVMDPYDPASNIGFDISDKERGLSNWLFFLGEHVKASPPYNATFYDDRYYTTKMPPFPPNIAWAKQINEKVKVTSKTDNNDYVGGYPPLPPTIGPTANRHALRLNRSLERDLSNFHSPSLAVMAVRKIRINKARPYLTYKYAFTLEPHPDGAKPERHYAPFFRVNVYNENCEEICCAGLNVQINTRQVEMPGVKTTTSSPPWGYQSMYKEWTTNTINFSQYFVDPNHSEEEFTISFIAAYCNANGAGESMGYALIDLEASSGITISGNRCESSTLTFRGPLGNSYKDAAKNPEEPTWSIYKKEGSSYSSTPIITAGTAEMKHKFLEKGFYKVRLDLVTGNTTMQCSGSCNKFFEQEFEIKNCKPFDPPIVIVPIGDTLPRKINCNDCIQSFAPIPGEKYVLSAWVKQDNVPTSGTVSYQDPSITIKFSYPTGSPTFTPVLTASGPIIDGWQKIEQEFTVPATATLLSLTLNGSPQGGSNRDVYFDDIRIFPFRADMKAFVYDPATQRLMSELDENNFATYYEYDEEGKLRRVKKETERGVMTIKEAGNNSSKR